jgi:hypothetical protein
MLSFIHANHLYKANIVFHGATVRVVLLYCHLFATDSADQKTKEIAFSV